MKSLFISPSYRDRGLGRKLTKEVLNRAKEIEYEHIYIDTLQQIKNDRNYTYRWLKEVEKYYDHPRNDTYYFYLALEF